MPGVAQPPPSSPVPTQGTPASQPASQPPASAPQTPPLQQTATVSPPSQAEYAGFWRRWLASIIDGFIFILANLLISVPFVVIGLLSVDTSGTTSVFQPATFLVSSVIQQILSLAFYILYPLYFIGKKAQTPGKMVMKIKVLRLDQKEPPGFMTAFLREMVGKFASMSVLCLGFFWMIWDKKKQTWHDKIASTIVIKTG